MKSENLLDQLRVQPYSDKEVIAGIGKQMGLSPAVIDTYLARFSRRKELYRLKNGLYVSADSLRENKDNIAFTFFLANVLRRPSYVTSWAALQYYNLTTEAIHTITSVTPKTTREYANKAGNFAYQSIDPALFTGFSLVSAKFDFFIASPAKALFDLLYFRTNRFQGMDLAQVRRMVEELRIDFDEMSKEERGMFITLVSQYLERRGIKS